QTDLARAGLEPASLAAWAPKTHVYANSTTGPSLLLVKRHHNTGHVIARAALQGHLHEVIGPRLRVREFFGLAAEVLLTDVIGQAVGREQQAIAGLGSERPHFGAGRRFDAAEEFVQNVLPRTIAGLFAGQRAVA